MRYSAADSSALPPISPIIIIPSQSGSLRNTSKQSMKSVPLNGSPPIPIQSVCPRPALKKSFLTVSYYKIILKNFFIVLFKEELCFLSKKDIIHLQGLFDLQPHMLMFLTLTQYQFFLFDVYVLA